MKITENMLKERVAALRKVGFDVSIQWAYGQPRIFNKWENRELSPRDTPKAIWMWLDGFVEGANQRGERLSTEHAREVAGLKARIASMEKDVNELGWIKNPEGMGR